MWRLTRTSLWSRRRRLIGACAAIVIGVGFLAATLVIGDTMRGSYDVLLERANTGSDVVVRSATELGQDDERQRATIDATVLGQLVDLDGVAAAVPLIEGRAQIIGADGKALGGDGPPTVGSNWVSDPSMNGYVVVEGAAPATDDEVVINRAAARDGKLRVGDPVTILAPAKVQMQISGIVAFGDEDSFGNTTFVGMTDAAATRLLAIPGQATSIQLRAVPGTSAEQLRETVASALPSGVEAITGAELTAEQKAQLGQDFLDFFEVFLIAFAGVALLVATFSIHNTFSILVAQRTRESALLRAIGASRRQIVASVTIEALVLGVVASVLALGVGLGLAMAFAAFMSSAGFGLPKAASFSLGSTTIVVSMAVGVGVTLIASVAPAIRASRIAPIAALRDVAIDRSGVSRWRAVAGALALAGGVTAVIAATRSSDGAVARAGLGALATLVGMVIAGPVVARAATGVLGAPAAALGGPTGSLARRNAMRNPRRSAGTASALMIGTAVVALFASVGSSMKTTFDDVIGDAFTGELVVEQAGFSGAPLDPSLAPALAALPEVHAAMALADAPMVLDGRETSVSVADPTALDAVADLRVTQGALASLGADGLAVSEKEAVARGWHLGDVLPVAFADGQTTSVTVRAIFSERFAFGDLIVTPPVWASHRGATGDLAILIDAADGVGLETVRAAVAKVTDAFGAPAPLDRDEFVDSQSAEVDQMLGVVYGMLALAIVIAVLGIANTLSLSIHERTCELGLLRAVGQSRRQLRRTVRWESVILAVFGAVGGLALGSFLGWGLLRAIAAQEGFGIYSMPVPTLAAVLVLAVVAGVLAAQRPARRAAKLDVLAAIAGS